MFILFYVQSLENTSFMMSMALISVLILFFLFFLWGDLNFFKTT